MNVLRIHETKSPNTDLNIVTVGDLNKVRKRPLLYFLPPIREFFGQVSAVSDKDVAVDVHGNVEPYFGVESESHIAGFWFVELVPRAMAIEKKTLHIPWRTSYQSCITAIGGQVRACGLGW